jgi:hypothetical protein
MPILTCTLCVDRCCTAINIDEAQAYSLVRMTII